MHWANRGSCLVQGSQSAVPYPRVPPLLRHRKRARVQAASAAMSNADGSQDKVLHMLRHGKTKMNVYLESHPIHSEGFQDPLLYDTRLAQQGKEQAAQVTARAAALSPPPELLVVSPLTRCLETATIVFPEHMGSAKPPCPVLVEPLWRERLTLSSDVGRAPALLAAEYPHLNFDDLSLIWWYTNSIRDPTVVIYEPDEVFGERMRELRRWLLNRPEKCIAIISHQAPLGHLTGDHWENTELRTLKLSELSLQPAASELRL